MAIGDRYKTGQKSTANAYYSWDGYTDGTRYPSPTPEEQKIKLETGDVFPPINSCGKGAYWKMTSYA
ncbi:YjzC family protein [Aquibacillus salsiterrae]|uniref:YjzC family protein n=1 Tax=Aquibacillus salsiterrae TaxID=2950439 RepID=A0A9X4AHD7_9BACI|nr:YjzC family protein [Aquibacillus salsiterrae]MDC3418088.1 YjzC family protein [Aquibacillus salsiterrae]